jgi:Fe-S cluster biosynthesis and repair protein YggX
MMPEMADRLVKCARRGRELPGLDKPPFPGNLAQRIFDNVSREAWEEWDKQSAELMTQRRWSMGDPQARKELFREMEDYFFGSGAAANQAAAAPPAPPGTRMVNCAKLSRFLPGLAKAPFGGELGQRIYDTVSEQAWKLWEGQATILMNHYGLSMADPEARKFLREQMEEFFFGAGAAMPADWIPPGPGGGGGKGGGGKGGGKGAPGARRK